MSSGTLRRTPGRARVRPPTINLLSGDGTVQKKTYSAPKIVRHGNAAEVTLGTATKLLELISWRPR